MNDGELTLAEALGLVASLEFRPFGEADYRGFSGVESENPMIAENEDFYVVLDGERVEFLSMNGHIHQQFRLNEV
jgi:hypothetical protein